MTELAAGLAADNADEVDPRWLRSRTRLLDAAVELLRSGGVDAVTVEAVTKASKVARTTLYRHFGSSSDLLAATLERLLPPGTPPPSTGSLRDRLVEMMCRQATLYEEAPLHLTTLAWAALRATADSADAHHWQRSKGPLQSRVVDHYQQAFEAILQSPEAQTQLDELDIELAVCQLAGPLVFASMAGLRVIDHEDCARIVDDFLVAHRLDNTAAAANARTAT